MPAPAAIPWTTFAPGDCAAGRFRIVRFIARGGVGEVYEAADELLQTRVALKTLRAHVADDAHALERFRREILFARRVTHSNVCRIFDVFHDPPRERTREAPIAFLTMELLIGETAAERLRRRGRLATAEALPIVAQLVSGLSAAHRAGIVHRDFKSGNVMLVPAAAGADRAVITDFGLAHAIEPGDASSIGGEMIGTSAYMAPEQVKGDAITAAADIYALGVVLYEMVTGAKPFVGESSVAIALKRLTEPAPPPSSHVADLDPRWEQAILRCLALDPVQRFAVVDDVLRALTGERSPALVPTEPMAVQREPVPQPLWLRRSPLAVTAVAVSLAAIAGAHRSSAPPLVPAARETVASIVKPRQSVAVLGFKSLSGRPDVAWLSTAFAEMLATELSAAAKLRTIPGENVARMKLDLALPDAESLSGDTLARIRASLGADLVVLGSYLAVGTQPGGQIRLDMRVQDAVAGETIVSIAETGTEGEILDLVARCGRRVRVALRAEGGPDARVLGRRHSLPGNPAAVRFYTLGLEKLRLFDPRGAAAALEQAVKADPAFPLASVALSEAWSALGYDAKAHAQARQAFENSRDLPREERLAVEARYHETGDDWAKAIELHRVLFGFFPDDVEYGLSLVRSQVNGSQVAEANRTLAALRLLPLIPADEARIDLIEAQLAQSVSDYPRELASAARAVARGEQVGARLLVASSRDLEGWALLRLGQPDEALRKYDLARAGFAAVGNRGGVARVLGSVGLVLHNRGQIAEARRHHEQALALFREVGDRGGAAWSLDHLGSIYEIDGDPATARRAYLESLSIFREIGGAGVVLPLLGLGSMALRAADLPAARQSYGEALASSRKLGARAQEALALQGLGNTLAAGGQLDEARRHYAGSLRLRESMGERGPIAESRMSLGALALQEGRPGEAESVARVSIAEFERQRISDKAAWALTLLAVALIEQQKTDEAQRAVAGAKRWAEGGLRCTASLGVGIAEARLFSARGDSLDARQKLEAISREAESARLPIVALEAQLALGQIEIVSGARASGHVRLGRVEQQAAERGLGLIAQKARRAAREGSEGS